MPQHGLTGASSPPMFTLELAEVAALMNVRANFAIAIVDLARKDKY